MGESCNIASDDDMIFHEKNKKRKLKTPSQLEALEKFYNEHKYPPESLKVQFAWKWGLSMKQIQVWFWHRRLKDKKVFKEDALANGEQDTQRIRQDLVSSSKQGESKNFNLSKVESQRFNDPSLTSEPRHRYVLTRTCSAMHNNASSESDSASEDRSSLQTEDHYDMKPLIYSSLHNNYNEYVNMDGKVRRGYAVLDEDIYFQENGEDPTISSVKRKLGRHYHEDGPMLGIVFQPLPPGAFDASFEDSRSAHSLYQVYDRIRNNVKLRESYPLLHQRKEFTCSNVLTRRPSLTSHSGTTTPDTNPPSQTDGDSESEVSEFVGKNYGDWLDKVWYQ
ncbi:homeobox-DDT domain protein RLT1 isoform X2 [Amborella trichopoda]|uniref:homeobox-DDT domain protein RLT1 isoform X2 n=1 Tax=Amborella trichopoda TaxID=13333 RepID=UPI0009BF24BF|nr:homeobox-DDT domain protein RLT1 isoform X2 [Amborella trichopoda]|eukprot:XP_020529479.1 homeobox-DDT domain protein RLT1 isoform X2 [Amborella trichopoda]